LFFWYVAKMLK